MPNIGYKNTPNFMFIQKLYGIGHKMFREKSYRRFCTFFLLVFCLNFFRTFFLNPYQWNWNHNNILRFFWYPIIKFVKKKCLDHVSIFWMHMPKTWNLNILQKVRTYVLQISISVSLIPIYFWKLMAPKEHWNLRSYNTKLYWDMSSNEG